jgi:hypothetical protein
MSGQRENKVAQWITFLLFAGFLLMIIVMAVLMFSGFIKVPMG